jgi:hypothetical protein
VNPDHRTQYIDLDFRAQPGDIQLSIVSQKQQYANAGNECTPPYQYGGGQGNQITQDRGSCQEHNGHM